MIWIKNHGIRGGSDNLRILLRNEDTPVVAYQDDGETTPIIKLRGWTGIDLDTDLPDEALQNAFIEGLGEQVRWAYEEDADHPDYGDKAEELCAYYDGSHPDLSDTS